MYVPNYIPPPLEVPRNVTQEKYPLRVRFIRRVSVIHFASVLMLGGLSMLPLPGVNLWNNAAESGALLLLLSLVRIGTRATRYDLIVSAAAWPATLVVLAMLVQAGSRSGWPIWGAAVGIGCSTLYALLCGRDFSFVGQYVLSLIASSVVLAVLAISLGFDAHRSAFLLAANLAILTYVVYDLASLLARRRLGEELAAVVDLYRDVFNVFGYVVRVARHWKKHRIWVATR